jgi:hypothetical protein
MRRLLKATGIIAAIGIGAGSLNGCGLLRTGSFSDDATVPERVTAVRVDSSSGSLTVTGEGGAARAAVHRSVTYRGGRPDEPAYRLDNGVLVLGGCGRNCSVDYTVTVPTGTPVTGRTSNGAITLTAVGDVDVRTSSGRIRLDRVAGDVRARTSNGQVVGHAVGGGQIQAQTSNGAIDLATSRALNVRAVTSNGDIRVAVPTGRYQVSARTNNGDRRIRVASESGAPYRLDLRSSNGDVSVEPA